MKGEIISIGRELLSGHVTDTNSSYIAKKLTSLGIGVFYQVSVGDDEEMVKELIRTAHDRAEVVIATGGLGPTVDDVTRESISSALQRRLEFRQGLMNHIEEFFKKRGKSISPNNKKQAYVPEGSIAIENPVGTAPGFIVKDEKGVVMALPGVPREMVFLMEKSVIPYLKKEFCLKEKVRSRVLKTCWIGESKVDDKIGDLMKNKDYPVGLLVKDGNIEIHITAKQKDEKKAVNGIKKIEKEIRNRLEGMVYGADGETLEGVVGAILKGEQKTVSIADSFTDGRLSQRFLNPYLNRSSFSGCLVFKDKEALIRGLSFEKKTDMADKEIAGIAAKEIRKNCDSDIGIAVTGNSGGPEGSFSISIALSKGEQTTVKEYHFDGILDIIKTRITTLSLEILRRGLLNIEI